MPAVPLYREIRLTQPLDQVFAAFLDQPHGVFLDSSLVHSHMGRYSYLAADPFLVLRARGNRISIQRQEERQEFGGDPFRELQSLLRQYPAPTVPDLPPFQGGAAGYFGYDLGQHLEVLPSTAEDDLGLPNLYLGFYDWVLAHDHLRDRTWVIASPYPDGDRERARRRLEAVCARVDGGPASDPDAEPRIGRPRPPVSNFTPAGYEEAVERAREYIRAGDIFQVCLSQRLRIDLPASPWALYRRLRQVSPVSYGAFLNCEGFAVASASPELFLRLEDGQVVTRPIKGTRPRGRTEAEDRALARELCQSAKDRAENVMIVDLLRNDLGRVCRVGSVHVPDLLALEAFSTVHHLVSTVAGELAEGRDAVDLLRACFPGGSITGCPKIRAMEIIDELEPTRRGIYCGSIGYLGFNGSMDTSIVIRTVIAVNGRAYLQVGGAVVADSDPLGEYQETLDKARATMLALEGL